MVTKKSWQLAAAEPSTSHQNSQLASLPSGACFHLRRCLNELLGLQHGPGPLSPDTSSKTWRSAFAAVREGKQAGQKMLMLEAKLETEEGFEVPEEVPRVSIHLKWPNIGA